MATVYLARDLRHDREVAIKVLRPELAATLGPQRFLQEIQIAARLTHPHILPLHDSGQADGFLFYVMPYVEGESLRDKLTREGELPVAEAVRILKEVTDALAYAHGRGVVHRDIKPENVMLSGRHALVTDFGVAKALHEATGRQQLTTAGVALGTPAYMAPEQAAADPHMDHRADLYAVGAMGYELLTGRPPFTGSSPQAVLAAQVTELPRPVTDHRPAVPPVMAGTIMRCLEKKPADRWQTAGELLIQLEVLAATPSGGMTPTHTQPNPAVAPSRRPGRIWLAVGAAAVLLVAAGLVWWRTRAPATRVSVSRLAVLPLRNATGDTADAILAEGLTREMISSLTRAGVKVIGFASVARYAGAEPDFDRVARDLNVDGVAVGSLVRMAGGLSIALELADPVTKENRWAGSYDVTSADVSLLAGRAAREMATAILGSPPNSDPARSAGSSRSVNPAAYQAYLVGKHYLDRFSRAGFLAAIEQFERAIALDSTFAGAYGALGLAYANGAAVYHWLPGEQAFPAAERAIGKAFELDPRNGTAYVARGTLRFGRDTDWKGAEADLRAALEIEPTALGYNAIGDLFVRIGATGEAVTAYERSVALEPTALSHQNLAWGLINAGEVAAARRELDAAFAVDSSSAEIHVDLAYVLGAEGLPQAGLAELDDYERRVGGPGPFHSVRGWLLAMQEPKAAAEARYHAMVKDGERLGPFVLGLAAAATVLGKYDEAIHWLEVAAEKRALTSPGLPWTKPLRQDPRFREVFRKAGIDVTRWDRQAPPDPTAPR